MSVIYKAVIRKIDAMDGLYRGLDVLLQDFENSGEALKACKEASNSVSIREIRRYESEPGHTPVIAVDSQYDTGKLIARDISGVLELLNDWYKQKGNGRTMSEFIAAIRNKDPELLFVRPALKQLHEDEIEGIIETFDKNTKKEEPEEEYEK